MVWWRRCAFVTLVVFGLSTAVPAEVVQGGSGFPLGWLTDLINLPRAWAANAAVTGLPRQGHGGHPGLSGYVPASATAANGGSGRAPAKVARGLDGYRTHVASPSATKTAPGRRGYVATTSKRQAAGSSAAMDQYANQDGTTTRVYRTGDANYRAADGSWQKIDPTLVHDGTKWTTKAGSVRVSLSTPPASTKVAALTADADADPAPDPLASVTLPGGAQVGYDLSGAAPVTPEVTGTTATYDQILPATDLVLQTITTGVEETLVLDSPTAGNQWVFPLHMSGLTPRSTVDGSIELVDGAGVVQAWFPHGSMTDAKFDPHSGDMTRSSAVTMSLTTVNGAPAVRVVADRTWLDDPARVYPVRVDPTLTTADNGDVYVDNDSSTTASDQAGNNLAVGTDDGGTTKARSFLHFGNFGTQVNGAHLSAASLQLYLTWQYSCTQDREFSVYPVAGAWSATTLATSSYPGPALASTALGSLTVTDPGAACTNTGSDRSVGKWVTVPLSVGALNDWTVNNSNWGLALTASVTDSNAWKRFTSERFNSGAYAPRLNLTYAPDVVPQVDTRYPADNATAETLTPQFVTGAHDPDNWPGTGLIYNYTVYNSTGTVVVSSGATTSSGWQVPAGKLAWNNTYFYTVAVGDKLHTAAESAAYAFTTTVPQPRLTSDLTQNPGAGFDPNNGNYTTSATDAQVTGVGPALEISRSYNSLDTRRSGAFGQGWSSILDIKATERFDTAGAATVVVTYPNGSEVAFGRNADGTFTAPTGRYAVLTAQTSGSTVTGYTLTDKDATQYVFGRSVGGGAFEVTSIADSNGRPLTFTYDGTGLISTMTSASGRKLSLTWGATPAPAAAPKHLTSVTTDPPTTGGAGYTWTYSYDTNDRLTTVCPPGTTTACTVYTWGNTNNQYANATLDLNPASFWRLNETSGGSAASSVLTNAGMDNGTYHNVTLGGAPALATYGSGSASASFAGAGSYVQLPGKLVADGSYQSVSMWFKTSTAGGVLFSYSAGAIDPGTTSANYVPALYVDQNGYLRGEFWQGTATPIKSAAPVTDGAWHHVVLSGAGNSQTMYVDGTASAPLAGTIVMWGAGGSAHEYTGAGFVGNGWPDHANSGASPAVASYFTGSIADVAFYAKGLTAADVATLHSVGTATGSVPQKITSPAGRVQAQVAVSNVTGQVTSVTDENGGVWTIGSPVVAGSSAVYEASVLGAKPVDYWRLGETGADVPDAVNEVAGDTASYSSVTLGGSGPFSDSTAAAFDGSTSNVSLPGAVAPAGASSVGVWFNTTATGQVLLGSQAGTLGTSTAPGLPTLWTGADGKLHGLSPSTTPTGPLASGYAGMCVDDFNNSTTDGNKIELYQCAGTGNQNWTWNADGTVRALGKCLDVAGAATTNNTKIDLYHCVAGAPNQIWQPYNGGLRNPSSGRCLDAQGAVNANGTQLDLYDCVSAINQKWTTGLQSPAAVNDGKWHQAVLTSSGTAQTLYLDGVKVNNTSGSVALTPGNQPYAYLGAGFTGAGWSGLAPNTTSYFAGKLAEAAFYSAELTADQVTTQWTASKQTVPVEVTTVDTTVETLTMPVKTVTVTDPGLKTISYAYDLVNNREVAETDALGNTTRYGYDTGGFSSLVYDADGVRTQNVQDERGNTIQQITCQDQSAGKCSNTYLEYYLNAANPVDPRNDVMTASRDARSSASTDDTYKTTYSYDAKGNPLATTDPLGRVTATVFTDGTTVPAYDSGFAPAGLPATITNAAGGVQSIQYYANGDVARTVSPAGEVSTYTYDKLGRKLTETVTTSSFPAGRTSTFSYDPQGRVLTEQDAPVTDRVTGAVHTPLTTDVYDPDGNMTSQTTSDPTGGDVARTETVAYNGYGKKQSQTDAVGKTTSFTYDAYGQVISETDADGGTTAFTMDAEGHVLTETMQGYTGDPNNPIAPVNQITESSQYDPAGRLATRTDAMGYTTAYTYTDDGQVATVTRGDGQGNSFVDEKDSYDPAGNLITRVTDNGTTETDYKYDAASRRIQTIFDPSGLDRVITNELSPDDNVVSTAQSIGSGSSLSVSDYQYDPEGRLRTQTAYNGDPATTPVGRWKLGETSGTTAADSAGNDAGTTSGVTWSTAAPTGHTGSAAFAGTTASRITTAGPDLDTTRSYTVSAWVNLSSGAANAAAVSQAGPVRSAFLLGYNQATNRWRILVSQTPSNGPAVDSSAAPVLNTWTQLTAVYDAKAKTETLYVNGAAPTSTTVTGMDSSGPLVVGGGKWDGQPSDAWPGKVADVQTYQRALTAAQVSAIAAGTAPAAGAGVSRTTNTVDEGGLVTHSIDPDGNATDITYDEGERPAVTTAAPVESDTTTGTVTARPVSYAGYDTFGDQTESVDANGNKSVQVYDRAGRVYETHKPSYTAPDGSGTVNPVSSVVYDTLGQVSSATDELGHVTRYTYDQLGRLAKTVAPNGGVSTSTYDLNGDPTSVTDPTGAVTGTTYDYLGRRATLTQAVRQTNAAYTTNFAYDTAGRLQRTTTPAGVSQSLTYDAAGETLTSVDGAGQSTATAYDGLGRATKVTQPDGGYRTTTYDMLSRPIGTASYGPGGGTALTTGARGYDATGNVLTSTDGRQTVTSFTYDPTGLVLSEKQPISATDAINTSFGYDLNGNQTRFTDGRSNAFWTTYNSWNQAESTIEPATSAYPSAADRTYTTSYDAAGEATTQQSPGGVTQTYQYDSTGDLTSQAGSGAAAATATRTFGYDLAGRLTAFSAPGGTNAVSYDDRGLPTSVTGPSGNSSFAYTPDGLMASRTDGAGTTSYGYDNDDRVSTLQNPAAGTDLTYGYDVDSAVSKITYGGTGNTRNFSYDGLHRLTGDELKTAAGASIAKIAYGWDANGNETSKTTTNFGGSTTSNTYGYDLADRLTSWNNGTTSTGYAYDASGNRTQVGSTTYTYDQRNRLVTDSTGVSYGYTARGTLSSVTSNTAVYSSASDAFDQAVTQSTGGGTRTFSYDALGRALQGGFAYTGMGNDLAADSGSTYVRDPDAAVVGTTSGGQNRLVWTDLHDDVVGQFTAAASTLAGSTVYDPLGSVKASAGMVGSLGYQSEWTDDLTGRVDMAARQYNPATGQFDSRDTASNSPVPDSVDANRYQFGDGNPLTVTDPSGHGWFHSMVSKASHVASSAWNTGTSYVSQAYSTASSYASYAYHSAVSTYYTLKADTLAGVSYVARKTGFNGIAKRADRGRKHATQRAREQRRRAEKAHQDYERKAHALKQRVVRAAHKAAKVVKDAKKATVKWANKHKKLINAIAIVATVAATIALGPVGGIVASIAINVAKDAVEGNINNWNDLAGSVGSGVLSGTLGAVTGGLGGAIGGRLAGMAAAKLGAGLVGKAMTGAISGGIGGGLSDIATQMVTTGHVNLNETAHAVAEGAVIGAVTGGTARCHSFDPSTEVVLADGTTKPIGEIKLGDKVLATNPLTGTTAARTVGLLHHNHDTDLANVTVKNTKTGRKSVLHTTWHHPFWNATDHTWTEAKDLKPGEKLRSPNGETTETVAAVKVWTGLKWMTDLTVSNTHTYYVIAGTTPVLVHNCGTNADNRAGMDFTDAGRNDVYKANADANGGGHKCEYCGRDVTRRPSVVDGVPQRGLPDDAQIDHQIPKSCGGCGDPHNGVVACRECNRSKSSKTLEDWDDELRDFLPESPLTNATGLNLIQLP